MTYEDLSCISSIFLYHFPDFTMGNSCYACLLSENPIFPHFNVSSPQNMNMFISWTSDNPLLLQHTSKFTSPLPSDFEETAAQKKLRGFWSQALQGENTDMKIICTDCTIHAHQFFLNGVPFF